ncbi:putative Carbonyl reductase [NADPH] 3 [Hypsibius exemplaris]|uniref:carbonyl reductase (NADPH) n=1 Tax=Hypsibius exemplaris TaxID=2072580 RepID=A0A1W0WEX3_HYPEX|nr:putative Carbonyl reductase [NADPH] 3 [Hypsibius exemplaris]
MAANSRAALVTGANKGIGLEIVRQLSPKFQGTVYLTARDVGRGQEAEKKLQGDGLKNVKFLQMDVNDKKSIEKARDFIKEKHGGLDVLINNAGILKFVPATGPGLPAIDRSFEAVKDTIATNVTGVLDVCNAFFPILRDHARIVNVSSELGSLAYLKNEEVKKLLTKGDLTVKEVEQAAADYIKISEKGNAGIDLGYPEQFGPYGMSKILLNAVSRVQQRDLDQDKTRTDLVVNSCTPGYVATDLNNNSGHRTVQQGADTPVYLATLPPSSGGKPVEPRGEYVDERKVVNWLAGDGWVQM